jgi:hypothetical protein
MAVVGCEREAQNFVDTAVSNPQGLTVLLHQRPYGQIRRSKMKKIVTVSEVEGEGLLALLGKRITFFCMNYIYTGNLVGVNDSCVLLEDAAIVYETGPFTSKDWKDAQKLPFPLYIQTASIEAFGELK